MSSAQTLELSEAAVALLCSSTALPPADLVEEFSSLELHAQTSSTASLLGAFYAGYLLALLLDGDVNESRHLLARVPPPLPSTLTYAAATALLRAVYARDYANVYTALASPDWPAETQPLKERFREYFQKCTLALVESAYTAIAPAVAAEYLGLEKEGVVDKLVAHGWKWESEREVLKPVTKTEAARVELKDEDDRVARLTGLVAHLNDI